MDKMQETMADLLPSLHLKLTATRKDCNMSINIFQNSKISFEKVMSERTFLNSANLSKPEITCCLCLNVKCGLYTLHTQENFTISSNLLKFLNFLWLSLILISKNGIKGFSNFKCRISKFYKTVKNV